MAAMYEFLRDLTALGGGFLACWSRYPHCHFPHPPLSFPAKAGIQYATAYPYTTAASGLLDPRLPGMTAEYHSAACNRGPVFFGAIQNASGRSNRKLPPRRSAICQIASEPITPAMVTINDTAPMSGMMPVRKSSVRVAAIGRKKAR